ncbi:MAG: TonB-dependent receptor domain-containing protein [Pyrinomonadaceae bacterium]
MKFSRLVVALVFVAACAVASLAQSNKGTIVGTVTDANGAVVKDAKVTATNVATGETRDATTGDEGTYTIPALDPGVYKITVDAQGFSQSVVEQVKLDTSSRQAVNVTLNAGAVSGGVVTVTAAAPLVETESSVRGDLITGREVTDLPIPQRNFTLLATLSPGVTRPFVSTIGGGGNFESGGAPGGVIASGGSTESTRFRESGGSVLVVNGARPTNNNFTLDGVDNNEGQFGQIAIYPPPDAIAEFKIETSVAPAEAGRAGGGIISTTTRSGGNNYHGSLYEFYQGRVMSALSRSDKRNLNALPNRNTHQFGGTVGGHVWLPRFGEGGSPLWSGKNRTFFFVYYEGQRNATPSTTGDFGFVSVPTARMRVGDFGELLQPGTTNTYNTIRGPVVAPRGTVFCANALPALNNDIRNCGQPLSQAALNLLQAYPLPNVTGRIFDNYATNRKEHYDRNGFGVRIDHNINQANTLFFAYSRDNSARARDNNFPLGSSPTGNDLPSGFGAGNEFGNSRGVRLGETHTFSPTVINDARVGVTRVEVGIFNTGVGGALGFSPNISSQLGIPGANICGECTGSILLGVEEPFQGGRQNQLEFIGDGGPFYLKSNNWSFADAVTWVRGTNTFKFGGDLRLRQNANFDAGRAGAIKGQYQYGTGAGGFLSGNFSGIPVGPQDSGSGAANMLLGYDPAFVSRGTPGTPPFLSNKELAFFGQDDWKVSPTLTLNLGLRWDMFTQPTERFDAQSNYNPATDTLTRAGDGAPGGRDLVKSDRNNFGPSAGFAWSGFKKDRTVVLRGGYAIKYATDTPGIPGILSSNPPSGASYSCSLAQYGRPACPQLPRFFNLNTGIPFPASTVSVAPGASFTAPAGANLVRVDPNIRNEMFHQYNLTVQWEFRPKWLAEVGYVGNRGRDLLLITNLGTNGAGFPGSRQVLTHSTVQNIQYTGKSWYDGFQSKLERRYSQGLSMLATYVWAHALDNSPGGFCTGGQGPSSCGFANPFRPELDKANADFDVRHRFTFASVWDLPVGRGRRYAGGVSHGADLVVGGWQLNTDITVQSGPPFSIFSNGQRVDISSTARSGCKTFQGLILCSPATSVFPGSALNAQFGDPKFGNTGRNIFRGARQTFVNASLFKNLHVTETFNIQLRAQAYNLFNHVNGFRPVNDLNSAQFGIDTAEQRRRQLEFGMRLLF